MPIRFPADADLDGRILRGLRSLAHEVDMRTVTESMLMAPKTLRFFGSPPITTESSSVKTAAQCLQISESLSREPKAPV
jgi:hypothetical protein